MKRITLVVLVCLMTASAAKAEESPLRLLKGKCVWQSVSYETTSGAASSAGPVTTLAQFMFDGKGNLTIGEYDVNTNGTFASASGVKGTYQIDSSGHGNFSFTSPVSGRSLVFDFLLTPKHHALKIMLQSDNNPPPLPRVASGECRFDE